MKRLLLGLALLTPLITCIAVAQKATTQEPALLAEGQRWKYNGKLSNEVTVANLNTSEVDKSVTMLTLANNSADMLAFSFIPANKGVPAALLLSTQPLDGDGVVCIIRDPLKTKGATSAGAVLKGFEFTFVESDLEPALTAYVENGDSSTAIGPCQLTRLK